MLDEKVNINAPKENAFLPYGLNDKPFLIGAYIFYNMFIYIITHPKFEGWCKIGTAQNVVRRFAAYQMYCPDKAFKLEFHVETPSARKIEQSIKHSVKERSGEWLYCSLTWLVNTITSEIKYLKDKKRTRTYSQIWNMSFYDMKREPRYCYLINDTIILKMLKDVCIYTGRDQSAVIKKFKKYGNNIMLGIYSVKRINKQQEIEFNLKHSINQLKSNNYENL